MRRAPHFIRRLRAENAQEPDASGSPPSSVPVETNDVDRDTFRFSPELFEFRTDVISELSERGFDWLTHYSSVDPIHDCYGLEVCGIRERDDAESILNILTAMFPDWRPG